MTLRDVRSPRNLVRTSKRDVFDHPVIHKTMINPRFKSLTVLLVLALSGCCYNRRKPVHDELSASQLRCQELHAENQRLLSASSGIQNTSQGLMAERQMLVQQFGQHEGQLSQQLGAMQTQLATANTRIDNLLAERNELKSRYAGRLTDTSGDPLVTASTPKIAGFQYDTLTGMNKFPDDVHFDLGSAELRPEAGPVLKAFANEVNSGDSKDLRILVVGHTDDQRIARTGTFQRHPTNWHLSTDRANQVILELQRLGVEPGRIGSMGHSKFQPVENGVDETSRQRNRRVELFIVPDSADVAQWDPLTSS